MKLDSTYNGNAWSRLTNELSENIYCKTATKGSNVISKMNKSVYLKLVRKLNVM